ncbi:MAG: hypothetical protein MZV63_64480 [Marinilabiliales bacterium]|nr:hypothetical protein [Marinilabiliales bacterium]
MLTVDRRGGPGRAAHHGAGGQGPAPRGLGPALPGGRPDAARDGAARDRGSTRRTGRWSCRARSR